MKVKNSTILFALLIFAVAQIVLYAGTTGKLAGRVTDKETGEPLFKLFDYHAQKYCPGRGKCLTEKGLRQLRKKEASGQLQVTHE